jgi:hypothetical protein
MLRLPELNMRKIDPRIITHGVPEEEMDIAIDRGATVIILSESQEYQLDKWVNIYSFCFPQELPGARRGMADACVEGRRRNPQYFDLAAKEHLINQGVSRAKASD